MSKNKVILNTQEIMERIPHRHPFLFLDKIVEFSKENQTITAVKCVSYNENFFPGHFPGQPIMPGVIMLEAMAQAGGVLFTLLKDIKQSEKEVSVYFMSIDKVKFRKPVVPGDVLYIKVSILQQVGKVVKMKGEIFVEDKLVCEMESKAMFAEGEENRISK